MCRLWQSRLAQCCVGPLLRYYNRRRGLVQCVARRDVLRKNFARALRAREPMLNVVRDQVHVRSLPLSVFCALAFLLRCPGTNEVVCERVGLCGGWNEVVGWWWLARGGWYVVAGAPRCLNFFSLARFARL